MTHVSQDIPIMTPNLQTKGLRTQRDRDLFKDTQLVNSDANSSLGHLAPHKGVEETRLKRRTKLIPWGALNIRLRHEDLVLMATGSQGRFLSRGVAWKL